MIRFVENNTARVDKTTRGCVTNTEINTRYFTGQLYCQAKQSIYLTKIESSNNLLLFQNGKLIKLHGSDNGIDLKDENSSFFSFCLL